MRSRKLGVAALTLAGSVCFALLTGCNAEAKRRPPPPPPPPPPVVVVIPYRPIPPNGASPNYRPPLLEPNGLYRSVNRNISPAQTVWNFRSAYNVAALNCNKTEYPTMIDSYRAFLRTHSRALTAANRQVDAEFRARHGARFVAPRERYMTEVYNHFALPMTVNDFCKAVLAVSRDVQPVTAVELNGFAARSLPSIQIVFDDFYHRYDQWKIDAAAWDAKYAPRPVLPVLAAPVPVATPAPVRRP